MGWAFGQIGGKDVGYSVPDICNFSGCDQVIDRGLAHACGGEHGETEYSCDRYFCAEHLFCTLDEGPPGQVCQECYDELDPD